MVVLAAVATGTINALVVSYYKSNEWHALAADTQKNRRRVIEHFRAQHGDKRVALLQREHLERMLESGRFGFCREVVLHSVEDGNAERVGGLARSLGLPIADPDDPELERELRITELEAVAGAVLGAQVVPFVFGYRVRLGVV